jgi:hypothetical protein
VTRTGSREHTRVVAFRGILLKGAIVAAVLLFSAACGSSSSSSAAAPAHTLSFCQDVAGLSATRESLTPVKGSLPTSTEMKAAAQDIQSSLAGLGRRTEWQTQMDNLSGAAATMQSAADSLAASPGARGVSSRARTAVAGVNDAIRRLVTAVGSRCPSSSPSPSS